MPQKDIPNILGHSLVNAEQLLVFRNSWAPGNKFESMHHNIQMLSDLVIFAELIWNTHGFNDELLNIAAKKMKFAEEHYTYFIRLLHRYIHCRRFYQFALKLSNLKNKNQFKKRYYRDLLVKFNNFRYRTELCYWVLDKLLRVDSNTNDPCCEICDEYNLKYNNKKNFDYKPYTKLITETRLRLNEIDSQILTNQNVVNHYRTKNKFHLSTASPRTYFWFVTDISGE